MLGVFLLVPVIIRIREVIGEKAFKICGIIFFVMSTIGLFTSSHELMWDPGYSFEFVGYFIMGSIMGQTTDRKNNKKGIGMVLSGFLVMMILSWLLYINGTNGIGNAYTLSKWTGAGSPPVAIASVLIFTGFSKLDVKMDFSKLAGMCFTIYLFHAGVWDVISKIITVKMDSRIVIPMMVLLVFFLSWALSIVWHRFWNVMDNRWKLSNRLCSRIGLKS